MEVGQGQAGPGRRGWMLVEQQHHLVARELTYKLGCDLNRTVVGKRCGWGTQAPAPPHSVSFPAWDNPRATQIYSEQSSQGRCWGHWDPSAWWACPPSAAGGCRPAKVPAPAAHPAEAPEPHLHFSGTPEHKKVR